MSRWKPKAPKEAAADLHRHVDDCRKCQYDAQACDIGKGLHTTWLKLANEAMDQIWYRAHR